MCLWQIVRPRLLNITLSVYSIEMDRSDATPVPPSPGPPREPRPPSGVPGPQGDPTIAVLLERFRRVFRVALPGSLDVHGVDALPEGLIVISPDTAETTLYAAIDHLADFAALQAPIAAEAIGRESTVAVVLRYQERDGLNHQLPDAATRFERITAGSKVHVSIRLGLGRARRLIVTIPYRSVEEQGLFASRTPASAYAVAADRRSIGVLRDSLTSGPEHGYTTFEMEAVPAAFLRPPLPDLIELWETADRTAAGLPDSDGLWAQLALRHDEMMVVEATDPAGSDYVYRHYGLQIQRWSGTDLTGRLVSSFPPSLAREFSRTYRTAIHSGHPLFTIHRALFAPLVVTWQRLVLPVRSPRGAACLVWNQPLQHQPEMVDALLSGGSGAVSAWLPAREDSDHVCLLANEVANAVAGPLAGFPLRETLPMAVTAGVPAILSAVSRTGVPHRLLTGLVDGDHPQRYAVTAMAAGRVVLLFWSDLASLIEAERERAEAESRFQDYALAAGDWFWETDADGVLSRVDGDYERMTGWGEAALLGRPGRTIFPGETVSAEIETIHQSIAARRPFRDHTTPLDAPIGQRWFRMSGKPRRAADGQFLGYRGVARDVTEERRREQALEAARRRERLLRAAIEATPVNITISDAQVPEMPLIYVNAAFSETTGYSREESEGANCRFLQGPETDPETRTEIRQAIQRGDPISVDVLNYRKSGESFWNRLSLAPIHDDDGALIAYIGVQRDVTLERRAADQQAVRDRMEALGRVAGGVAHEINNLLQPMLAMPPIVAEDIPAEATEAHEALGIMESSARKAADVVRGILGFSRSDRAKLVPCDLTSTVAGVLDFIVNLIPPGIRVERVGALATGQPMGPVVLEANQLVQVLTNLLLNAGDAMGGRGFVRVAVGYETPEGGLRGPQRAVISVTDHGIGMSEATKKRLFEPFFTTKPVGKGTGLGLPVVYGIVNGWSGTISIQSELGQGSTFSISLPLQPVPTSRKDDPITGGPGETDG